MGTIKSIGILTSGGDAPGMNAAIRAVTRSAIYNGLKVYGIYRGYKGLVTDEIQEFKSQNVSNIIQMGGTILKTARCKEFTTPEGRAQAYENMKNEIQTYENNLGFLTSSSKKGSSLVTEMNRKVEKLKADLELILKKIEVIDQSMKDE